MTRRDAFEADLFSVFDDDAQAPIPAGGLERLHAAIANQQPRPARLAGLGSRWIGDSSGAPSPLGALRAGVPVLRLSAALLLLLLTLALIGTAALIGGRLLERPTDPDKLLYELGGDIFLASADGSGPTRVAEGAVLFEGSTWAPDGRHFVSFDTTRLTADIRDPDGHVVASFANLPGFSGYPVWSPDSTRLQAWTQSYQQIDIYGIDGVLQAELPLPEGYTRLYENLGAWAPDGRSVWVRITPVQSYPCTSGTVTDLDDPPCAASGVWALPIDGSAPRRLADDHPFARGYGAFSRDGRRVAYVTQPLTAASTDLVVANGDGSDARTVATGDGLSGFLEWSPDGEHLAYYVSQGSRIDLVVLELATGTVFTAVPDFSRDGYPPFSWSSASDELLFAAPGDGGDTSLWSVNVDGTGRTLLVQGATWGAMPPDPPGDGHAGTGITGEERDIEVGAQPTRQLDVVGPEEGGGVSFEVPVGGSGATRAFMNAADAQPHRDRED